MELLVPGFHLSEDSQPNKLEEIFNNAPTELTVIHKDQVVLDPLSSLIGNWTHTTI